MKLRVTEKETHWGIVKTLRELGAAVYSTAQSRPSKVSRGIPDLIVFYRGRFTFAEVKKPDGKVTPHQEVFRDECYQSHVRWECWRSVEDAVKWIRKVA